MKETYFTRKRLLWFGEVISCLLMKWIKSLQIRLNEIALKCKFTLFASASALCQARQKLKHTAFIELNERAIIEPFYQSEHVQTRHGHFLKAIDGSKISIPDTADIRKRFPVMKASNWKQQYDHTQAMFSCLYDPLNKLSLHACFEDIHTSEAAMAYKHIKRLNNQDILLLDRLYPWYILFNLILNQGANFVARCRRKLFLACDELFNEDCKVTSKIVTLTPSHIAKKEAKEMWLVLPEKLQVRFVRLILSTGEVEVLATSLDQEHYPDELFQDLYFKRRGIETYYDILKNRLQLENFSWETVESLFQDVYSTVFLSNLETICTQETNEELTQKCEQKWLQNKQQVNHMVSFNAIKNSAFELLFWPVQNITTLLNKLKRLFHTTPTPIRPWRKFPRNRPSDRQRVCYYREKKKYSF